MQIRLARFGKHLALAILIVCMFIFAAGLLQEQPALLMFLTAVSLAVAAIPEALPAVVTISWRWVRASSAAVMRWCADFRPWKRWVRSRISAQTRPVR
ncbi:MAG: hypothetical protein H6940_04990 [Burkholderiales bacterium]|nr:hypothetical protein [Burkholderiales bacterium]